jgi:dihydrofolate synthase/folylpolyglutamate synthase
MNSSIALAAAELLDTNNEFNIDFKNIQNALKSVEYEGRFEILSSNPYLILDAAHNTASVKTVVNTIDELKVNKKFTFLVSMLKDKNHEEYLSLISGNAEKIVITKIPNERGAESEYLYDISKKYLDNVEIVEDYKEAFEYVKTLNTHICITGSIYLIGLIKEYIGNRS